MKLSASNFIHKELKENPEFYKAFPHLAQEGQVQPKNFTNPTEKTPYFQSLLHNYNEYMPKIDAPEELIRDNELNFVQAYGTDQGPLKYLTQDQKDLIHNQIDGMMEEIEATGLSRFEILHEQAGKGVQLKDDPFWQLIKKSKVVREMMIPPSSQFTAHRVVELALRQDVGPDRSMMMGKQNYKYSDQSVSQPVWEYKKKYRDRDPVLKSEAFYAGHDMVTRQQRQAAFELEKPATFINRPLSRAQIRKRFMRSVQKDDIDWRNTAMISKFLNESGKLYNRHQSRLPTSVHRKVAKVVKKCRSLGLLPYVGQIKPTDKISLGSYIQDIEEMHKKTIDPVTGRMYVRHTLLDDARDKARRAAKNLKQHYEINDEQTNDSAEVKEIKDQIVREMLLDNSKLIPNSQQREWLSAQAYVLERDGAISEMEQLAAAEGRKFQRPNLQPVKEAYTNMTEKIKKLNDPLKVGTGLLEDYLYEKSQTIDRFARPLDEIILTPAKEVEKSEEQLEREIENLIDRYSKNQSLHAYEEVKTGGRKLKR